MLIGVTGYARHGKDSVAAVLVEDFGFTRLAFADTLKSLALTLDPIIDFDTLDEGYDFGPDVTPLRLSAYVNHPDVGWEGAKQNPEVRRFLQVLGTEGVRGHLGEDAWVNAVERQLGDEWVRFDQHPASPLVYAGPSVVIPDVRFPNEAEAIARWGGTLWRVRRPAFNNGVGTQHASEKYVERLLADAEVFNGGSLGELRENVHRAATALGLEPVWVS